MAKVKAEENFKRYRFSVPNADASINRWVSEQSNLSMSLRMLIGECIERNGYGDYTCRERIPGARRGRPPKASYAEEQDVEEQVGSTQPVVPAEPVVSTVTKKPVSQPVQPKANVPLSDDDIAAMFQ